MHIGIVGLGLIGGSLIKKLHSTCDIFGYDIDESIRQKAKQSGFRVRHNLEDLLHHSEIVVIAAPTNSAIEILQQVTKSGFTGLVTDIGSTKLPLHQAANKKMDFIGGHPMAGSHLAGWDAAEPELFNQAPWALTLDQVKVETRLAILIDMILKTGAWVVPTFAKDHDQAVMISSHLSHLVSAAYGLSVSKSVNSSLTEQLVGGSYRDLTRITLSPSERTSEIVWPNRVELIAAIENFVANLSDIKKSLKAEEPNALNKLLEVAGQSRFRVDQMQQKIKKQNIQSLNVPKTKLIAELKNLATTSAAVVNFKASGESYEISFVA
jgi:prephenate dehydrogenase